MLKKILFVILCGASSCMPKDAYKAKYEQQEIYLRWGSPLTFKESNHAVEEKKYEYDSHNQYVDRHNKLERKRVGDTIKFIGQENFPSVDTIKRT